MIILFQNIIILIILKTYFYEELKNDLKYLEKFEYEIEDFCEKYLFKKQMVLKL